MKCVDCEYCRQDFDGGIAMPYSCVKNSVRIHMPADVALKDATVNDKCGKMKKQV